MTPLGVLRSRTADRLGRDIFFVAACRALGIPARINEINGKVQYFDQNGKEVDVTFDLPSSPAVGSQGGKGRLALTYRPTRYVPDAQYYTHFTLSRLDADSRLQLLTYPEEATARNTFAAGIELDAGTYVLTTGTRLADGSVLADMRALTVTAGITNRIPFTLREQPGTIAVIGSLNAEHLYQPLNVDGGLPTIKPTSSAAPSLLSTAGRGYYVLGLVSPNHEPSNHALRDIARVASGFNAWGRTIFLLFDSPASASRFDFTEFYPSNLSSSNSPLSTLPSTIVWGTDIDNTIRNELITSLHLTTTSLPIFVIADSFNRVVYVQQGYTIHLGNQMLKVIKQLK